MYWIDLLIIATIVLFAYQGFRNGFLRSLVSVVGFVISTYLAVKLYEPISFWLVEKSGWGVNFTRILVFIIIIVLVTRLIYLIYFILYKTFRFLRWIPLTRTINRILGSFFGFIEGILLLGFIFFFLEKHPFTESAMKYVDNAVLPEYLSKFVQYILKIIPHGTEIFDSTVNYIV
ncbi:MAG: hypothetical protein GF349_01790 [Candidatus Magasanikbacteria bacterium]|nr:hypothetical protein [Candidatus Magasanikbacteria bacterium]